MTERDVESPDFIILLQSHDREESWDAQCPAIDEKSLRLCHNREQRFQTVSRVIQSIEAVM